MSAIRNKLKKVTKKLKERTGEWYIDTLVTIFILLLVLSLLISFLPPYIHKQQLNTITAEIIRLVEIRGRTDGMDAEIQSLITRTGMDFEVVFEGTYIGATQKVQLQEEFKVTVKYTSEIGISFLVKVPIVLINVKVGRSEKYWK